ncbi:unnamed protein product [Spirodela intermedia]|uniref:Uncharacterized protein n=2 Tax=Spirodela intermedia TaxID=51605 RepID=A0A7I8IXR4_SPIIN|nr:unnamed protein product [Spirodela intermedia]CAA6662366.1 unnamed protein product [Spirodela intermedia]CAA7398765.1 unnamed protein product [Spirodela intermedia]
MELSHSGARYPMVPLIITLASNLSSRRMFWGLMSRWTILCAHSWWR